MDQKFEVLLTLGKRPHDPPLALARRIFADLKGCTVLSALLAGGDDGTIWRLTVALKCAAVATPITRRELRMFISIVTDANFPDRVRLEDVRQLGIGKVEQTVAMHFQTREKQ
jgi:hypothetical protein